MNLFFKIGRALDKNGPIRLRWKYTLYYLRNKRIRQRIKYIKQFESDKLNETTILYESHHGESMGCNPYAIFRAMLKNPEYSHFTHVWVVNDTSKVKPQYRTVKNIIFIEHNSKEYYHYLAYAKYLISNATFPQFFIRKPEQIYLNTWHGTPLKTLGKEIKNGKATWMNFQRNFLQATHIIHPNKFTADYIAKVLDIKGFCRAKIFESGYPRQDLTLSSNASSIKKQLGIDPNKKVVLWAPTWRGSMSAIDTKGISKFIDEYTYMKESLGDEYLVLLRLHQLASKALRRKGLEGLESSIVDETTDTNELLAVTDVLVTDYSSIAIDFLATKRPLVLYCQDLEYYEERRGFIFDPSRLPAPLCRTIKQTVQAVQEAQTSATLFKDSYKECQGLFTYLDDGMATQRAIDFMLDKKTDSFYYLSNNKMNLLFYCGSFISNGVTNSALNLLNNLDREKYNIAIVLPDSIFHKKQIRKHPEMLGNLSQLSEHINICFRSHYWMSGTLAELVEKWYSFGQGIFPRAKRINLLRNMYSREFKRLFGNTHFDVSFDFAGYSADWASLIAFGGAHRKIAYLHSDMLSDSERKVNGRRVFAKAFPIIFPLYQYFDKLISVSKTMEDINRDNLAELWDLPASKFTHLDNVIDYQSILEKASANSLCELFDKDYYLKAKRETQHHISIKAVEPPCSSHVNFAIVGRISPEKGHKRAILAFERALDLNADIRLYIIGDGPLRRKLKKLCNQRGIRDKVIFTGNLNNPFAYLELCDCLVSSSKYEGQPLAPLEALVLEKAIFATAIAGNISVLEDGKYGEIVPDSIDGLYEGFKKYLQGEIVPKKFNYIEHNNNAMKAFDNLLSSTKYAEHKE